MTQSVLVFALFNKANEHHFIATTLNKKMARSQLKAQKKKQENSQVGTRIDGMFGNVPGPLSLSVLRLIALQWCK